MNKSDADEVNELKPVYLAVLLVSWVHAYAYHLRVIQSRAFGGYQSVPESENAQQLKFLAHQEHEPAHRVVLVRDLRLFHHLAPAFSIGNSEDSIKMMDVPFKAADFLVELADEPVPHVSHDTAEGTEYIRFEMHEVYREYIILSLSGFWRWILSILVWRVAWRDETAAEPETVVEDGQYFVHALDVFKAGVELCIDEEKPCQNVWMRSDVVVQVVGWEVDFWSFKLHFQPVQIFSCQFLIRIQG